MLPNLSVSAPTLESSKASLNSMFEMSDLITSGIRPVVVDVASGNVAFRMLDDPEISVPNLVSNFSNFLP